MISWSSLKRRRHRHGGRHADGKLFSARGRERQRARMPERETESLSRTVFTYRLRYRPIGIRRSGKWKRIAREAAESRRIIRQAINSSRSSCVVHTLNRSPSIRDCCSSSFLLGREEFRFGGTKNRAPLGNIRTTRTMVSLWLAVVRNCRKMAAICGTEGRIAYVTSRMTPC